MILYTGLPLFACAARNAHEHCTNCLPEAECRLRGLMLVLRDEMATMLDRVSLADPIMLEPPFPDVAEFADSPTLASTKAG